MEEFNKSVKSALSERLKNPFTGTFILAWIACNWKLLVAILFISEADLDGITRIDYIEGLDILTSTNLVCKPFGITVIAIVLFSIFNLLASLFIVQFKNLQFTFIDKRTKVDATSYGKVLDTLKNIEDKWAKEIELINTSRADLTSSNREYILKNNILIDEANKFKEDSDRYEQQSKTLGTISNLYKGALHKASELLDRYREDYGPIKRARKLYKTINKIEKGKSLEERILDINKAYDGYIEKS